ncbi:MAG: sodium:calcium antiporter [Anaerolineales bacterium]|nr:sodium:calcium antiporter [Anaerolineales bacterium]
MVWIEFILASTILVVTAMQLAKYSDVIAIRTRLGGMFVGTLLLAGATSLPEFLTMINSLSQDVPNLAAGNMFGSNMFNMFMLALLDLTNQNKRILRQVAMKHALTAGLAILLIGMAVFFIQLDANWKLGWLGVDSLLIIAVYLGGVRLLQGNTAPPVIEEEHLDPKLPSLRKALLGFGFATLILVIVAPTLVATSAQIAEITGMGTGFIGILLVGMITSLPELVTTTSAVRMGAYDLAVGNLFGSNIFNMFALGLTDIFMTSGRFLGAIDPVFAMVGMLSLLLTALGLIGNLARLERRIANIIEIDALLLIIVYIGGLWLLYSRGVGV